MKTAIICGVSGQDGAYLAQFLLQRGYRVIGTSRDASLCSFHNLKELGIFEKVERVTMLPADFASVLKTVERFAPSEIYNLSGQSSVGYSFENPAETFDSIVNATIHMLEVIRLTNSKARFYNAGSAECFGHIPFGQVANEGTPFNPKSPYAIAKVAAHSLVKSYRESYGIYACTGILFNHESPLRSSRFVTKKIIESAVKIAKGANLTLTLGDLSIRRDWGWSAEYVQAMWQMLQLNQPEDFVIATGQTNSLEDFVSQAFKELGLDWRHHVQIDPNLFRPNEILENYANCQKARDVLAWTASSTMRDVVAKMIQYENAKQNPV